VAVILVVAYVLISGIYIWSSGILAARAVSTVMDLYKIELLKGTAFVAVTGILLLLFSWALLSLIARQEVELVHHRNALVESERRATAGLFASSVAHDINNILMAMRFDVEELEQEQADPDKQQVVQQIGTALDDLTVLARRLMTAGKRGIPGEFTDVDMTELARETVDYVRTHSKARTCRIDFDAEQTIRMRANPTIIRQMLSNLILNAADATDGKGHILVRLRQTEKDLILEVHDNGPGIAPERREAIFTEMQSTKPQGTGLGLLSVKVYAEAHQGTAAVMQSFLGGACFQIVLPLHERARHGILAEVF
jgi:two-component system sensor histidine kinase HydH